MNKRKGEKYKLIWKDKPDFVRMAAKSGALIIPFAAVGGDDAFDIAMDTDEVLANPLLGPLARRVTNQVFKGTPLEGSDDAVTPITKLPGLGLPSPLPLPKLERLYFRCSLTLPCPEPALHWSPCSLRTPPPHSLLAYCALSLKLHFVHLYRTSWYVPHFSALYIVAYFLATPGRAEVPADKSMCFVG